MTNLKSLAMAGAVLSILTTAAAMAQQPSHQHDPAQKPLERRGGLLCRS
jgi:hypothetical protein